MPALRTTPMGRNSEQTSRFQTIQGIGATVSANAMTVTLTPVTLDFRSSTLNSGTVNSRDVYNTLSLTIPANSTLGTTNGSSARIVVLAIDNNGTVELAVTNNAGNLGLDESGLISTTAITAAPNNASVTGSIVGSSGVLTVSVVGSGTLAVGQTITGTNIPANSYITGLMTGTGGTGTYQTNVVVDVAATAITAVAPKNVVYSTTARSNVPYRVVGFIETVQTTAGLWASAPTKVQGGGGQALLYNNTANSWNNITDKPARLSGMGFIDVKPKFTAKSVHGGILYLVNGSLYSSSGSNAVFATVLRAINGNYYTTIGADNPSRINIQSVSPVVDYGGCYGAYFALTAAGELFTWGNNANGQCGNNTTTIVKTPYLVTSNVDRMATFVNWSSYAVENSRIMWIGKDGLLYGMGYNGYGQLGDGTTVQKLVPTVISTFAANTIKNVWVCGNVYGVTFVQTNDLKIWAAGYNGYGQLGNNTTTNLTKFTDVTSFWVPSGKSAEILDIQTFNGYYDTAANASSFTMMMFADRVMTCGMNTWNNIGNGNATQTNIPYTIPNLIPKKIAMTGMGCHVLTTSNEVYAWGYNSVGQLANGTTTNIASPVLIASMSGTVNNPVCVDLLHSNHNNNTYGYRSNALFKVLDSVNNVYELWMTGYNGNFEIGAVDSPSPTTAPVKVQLPKYENGQLTSVDKVWWGCSTSEYAYFVLTAAGNVYGWGYNGHGMVIDAYNLNSFASPVNIPIKFQ